MTLTTTTHSELDRRTRRAVDRTMGLLRSTDPRMPLRFGEWRTHDVAAHLLTVMYRYTQRDITSPEGLSDDISALVAQNRDELAQLKGVAYSEVLDRLRAEVDEYLSRPSIGLDERMPFHGRQTIDGAGAAANVIGEFAIHGYDVARATGTRWQLDDRDMTLVINGNLQVAPAWLRPEARSLKMAVVLRVRGATPQRLRFADGGVTIADDTPGLSADAVISAPASTLALLLYQRISLPVAAMRGVMVTGGRRPWLGLKVTGAFLPI